MASTNFRIFKVPDEELIQAFESIADECGAGDGITVNLQLGEGYKQPLSGTLADIKENEAYKSILKTKASIFHRLQVVYSSLSKSSIVILREDGSDNAAINFTDQAPPEQVALILAAAHRHLRVIERTENIDRLLGDELAEFYRRREEGLLKLEELTQSLIERNEEYRRTLDSELAASKSRLAEQHETRSVELKTNYEKKAKQLEERETALNELKKQIDDRSSKHARRQIRSDLKTALENRAKEFTLTKKTARKRVPIHLLFLLLISSTGLFITQTLKIYDFTQDAIAWWPTVKLGLGAFAFIASIIFYIRWNDNWFRQHADEEFRLKRLELDIDRASWVVEMALEWKEEEGREIPPHLIERLTDNLFHIGNDAERVSHPSEDLASAIMSASSGITLKIPGLGEVAIDRKGIRKLERELSNRKTAD